MKTGPNRAEESSNPIILPLPLFTRVARSLLDESEDERGAELKEEGRKEGRVVRYVPRSVLLVVISHSSLSLGYKSASANSTMKRREIVSSPREKPLPLSAIQ